MTSWRKPNTAPYKGWLLLKLLYRQRGLGGTRSTLYVVARRVHHNEPNWPEAVWFADIEGRLLMAKGWRKI